MNNVEMDTDDMRIVFDSDGAHVVFGRTVGGRIQLQKAAVCRGMSEGLARIIPWQDLEAFVKDGPEAQPEEPERKPLLAMYQDDDDGLQVNISPEAIGALAAALVMFGQADEAG